MAASKKVPKDITARLKRVSLELRKLDDLLKSEISTDQGSLNEFRYEMDTVRLTAWTVSEMINARRARRSSDAILTFLASERLRRMRQMVQALGSDIDQGHVTAKTADLKSFFEAVTTVRQHA